MKEKLRAHLLSEHTIDCSAEALLERDLEKMQALHDEHHLEMLHREDAGQPPIEFVTEHSRDWLEHSNPRLVARANSKEKWMRKDVSGMSDADRVVARHDAVERLTYASLSGDHDGVADAYAALREVDDLDREGRSR